MLPQGIFNVLPHKKYSDRIIQQGILLMKLDGCRVTKKYLQCLKYVAKQIKKNDKHSRILGMYIHNNIIEILIYFSFIGKSNSKQQQYTDISEVTGLITVTVQPKNYQWVPHEKKSDFHIYHKPYCTQENGCDGRYNHATIVTYVGYNFSRIVRDEVKHINIQ